MRAKPTDTGGRQARHGMVQHIETAAKVMGIVQGVYNAGKVIAPYVRPVLTAIAAAAV